ncbi:MAG: pyruvate dehydrogenase (acetyl-transferring) E1 component subunit alpha [Planctomycetaceae bacterium]|jgi:pyruvate dehydrogenase E1 component alpha subunit|nr:pyruvate dehydrogenase (acetyl-transferring) E1 component subunit alpha [Phycisphaerales bacterium]MCE2654035.1 pyruvate dehydrogenase (acetyl-transferring) E1 component subunit alpha [Planctomycetaceae bacterium]
MPVRTAYQAKIEFLQILDEHGHYDAKLAPPGTEGVLTDEQAVFLYERMIECRRLDEIAFTLQRSGRMYTYPQNKGQEAAALGSGFAMRKGTDWLVPCYRENAALFLHGLPMHLVFLHWMGDERGNAIPAGVNVTPIAIPIGTQMLHATGMAWAFKMRKDDRCVITYFGDGATSEGDFHEAMNFATTFNVPAIFFCQNNQWAISVPREQQMASETVAQKALAYGAQCVQVDGNDIFAVYKATYDARERARAGGGVTLIEAVTYRLGDHTTADDARRYRNSEEVEAWQSKDPLIRLRKFITAKGLWDDAKQAAIEEKAKAMVAEVVKKSEGIEKPSTDEMFNFLYAQIPEELRKQRDTLRTHSLGLDPAQAGLRAGSH